MDIVILAGGGCPESLKSKYNVEFRSELPIGNTTILDIVINAAKDLGRIIVVGGPSRNDFERVESAPMFIGSLGAGISRVQSERFLLVTGDLPFLSREAVEDFLKNCHADVGLNYPVIPVAICEHAFPGMRRTSIKTKIGRLTGGNLAEGGTSDFRAALPHLQRAYELRKSPTKLASLVGLGTLVQLAIGQVIPTLLSIERLERAVSRVVGTRVKAVLSEFAEIGADIDNEEQYLTALDLLKQGQIAEN